LLLSHSLGTCLLNPIWSYWHKQKPNGDISKYKSCICVDGSHQQYRIYYWNTYAPVVDWSTLCLMLILSTILDLSSHQVDYIQAFVQASLNDPVYMQIPQGWHYEPQTNAYGYMLIQHSAISCTLSNISKTYMDVAKQIAQNSVYASGQRITSMRISSVHCQPLPLHLVWLNHHPLYQWLLYFETKWQCYQLTTWAC